MLAVIMCNLFTIVALLGLLSGMTVGFITAGPALADAMAFEPFMPLAGTARPA